jgi:glycosyltransferase involved in cell wall biosynthesis
MTYALVAIVKDEAENIDRFLDSAMRYCDSAVIVDTGSTDGTLERLHERGVEVYERPFDNFGASRSFAFAQARGKADWLLALDADMTVEIDPDFVPDPKIDAYLVRMGDTDFTYWLPLVLRGDIPWRSVGVMHEYTTCDRDYRADRTDKVRVTYTDRSNPAKTRWQLDMLRKSLKGDPHNARTWFYIAQCWRELGQPEKSRKAYVECIKYSQYPEEKWYAQYVEAALRPDWQDRVTALLAAWETQPARLEPLCAALRDLNSHDLHQAAYALCRTAEPYFPQTDGGLFLHTWVWDWGIAFERHIAAWWVGKKDESATLGKALLDNPRLPVETRAAVVANLECQ